MNVKLSVIISLLFALSFSAFAQADSENYTLTIRQLPNDEYEAVISYGTDVFCFLAVTPASSVTVIGEEVLIESPESEEPIFCFAPPPPYQYFEETAHIGELPPGNYIVTWVQPEAFSISTRLDADGYSPIPSTSAWSLILLTFGVFAVYLISTRTRSSASPN